MINGATLIAVEGTHGSGKTTLALALASALRERGVHAQYVNEPGRSSPLIEDVVVNRRGFFSVEVELDLIASQITALTRETRLCEVAIMDKTVCNTAGYARALSWPDPQSSTIVNRIGDLAAALVPIYDCVFYLSDIYSVVGTADPYRVDEHADQRSGAEAIESTCHEFGLTLCCVPTGLTTMERLSWCLGWLEEAGFQTQATRT